MSIEEDVEWIDYSIDAVQLPIQSSPINWRR